MIRLQPSSTLFPYTTLFRSQPLLLGADSLQHHHAAVSVDQESALEPAVDRKSTRLNSSHSQISYAVFCLKNKKTTTYFFELSFSIRTQLFSSVLTEFTYFSS